MGSSGIQKCYLEPIKEDLIVQRVRELKQAGVLAAVSSIPQKAERFGAIAEEAARIFLSSNPPFPLSNICPPNTNPSRWPNSAAS